MRSQARVELVRERLLLDEDVADVAARGLRRGLVLLLVLAVVRLDLVVRDGDPRGHLLLDALPVERDLDPLPHFLVGEALLLQRLLVALLDLGLRGGLAARLARVELLLDLVEPRLDVGVADLDPHLRGLLLVLAR